MKIVTSDNDLYDNIAWENPVAMSYIPEAGLMRIFNAINTEKSGEKYGQIFIEDKDGINTICRGDTKLYQWDFDKGAYRVEREICDF